ncbi:MAG: DUF5615 family PIN-like protein [Bacteroidales bacterium]|nr:DUF5615 family PIN-like protein [Bacteroidales bacterium]
MKFLFDQNISFRIIKLIIDYFPESTHILNVNLINSSDKEIWDYAKMHNYIIVTQDSDFNDLAVTKGFPPKIIWLKIGNLPTQSFADLLIELKKEIIEFLNSTEYGIFEIHKRNLKVLRP